ncbi:auxin-responsive protein SAUR78-like [Dendrobium catenatum]|uniref:Uncharacterized protein n=1 Tax=Dendrobium catenatum TaxID=906689 RepID=A0A2I0WQB5_9ASPA|nr:auxin-responsive protein SAUR78-like [Dendrobium catenatum]PKU77862.1 hypothetical protein MA16_Dca005694 [Dendrobium catenatum]
MKKIKVLLRKCKSLSATLGRSSSYTSLRSKSTKSQDFWCETEEVGGGAGETIVFVGSSRRRYIIRAKYLSHPVIKALIDRSSQSSKDAIFVNCEVVLFDHLLWMLENGDHEAVGGTSPEELAALYAC